MVVSVAYSNITSVIEDCNKVMAVEHGKSWNLSFPAGDQWGKVNIVWKFKLVRDHQYTQHTLSTPKSQERVRILIVHIEIGKSDLGAIRLRSRNLGTLNLKYFEMLH